MPKPSETFRIILRVTFRRPDIQPPRHVRLPGDPDWVGLWDWHGDPAFFSEASADLQTICNLHPRKFQ